MYESQIDAIEEWSNKAIDAYKDYIDLVKESLDAERDLYQFKKETAEKTKNIAELERRIASLSGSDNASDIAERRKLEKDLYDAKGELEDSYYDRAMSARQDALDQEAQAYEESMNNYIEKLRDTLDEAQLNMDLFMESVTAAVMLNAETIRNEYTNTGIVLDQVLTEPWDNAAAKMTEYETDSLSKMNSWTTEEGFFGKFKTNATNQLESPWRAGTSAAESFRNDVSRKMTQVVDNVKSNVQSAASQLSALYKQIQDTERKAASANYGNNNSSNSYQQNNQTQKTYNGDDVYYEDAIGGYGKPYIKKDTRRDGYVYSFDNGASWVKESDVESRVNGRLVEYRIKNGAKLWNYNSNGTLTAKYAKGTTGTKKDEWAYTDEPWLGDEIVLVPGKNGNLSYMRKGTAVMPADISENLMEWGKINPNMANLENAVHGINLMSNYINKPEIKLDIENFLRCDNVSQDALPELKKFVDDKMNSLIRQLNYGLKRAGAK